MYGEVIGMKLKFKKRGMIITCYFGNSLFRIVPLLLLSAVFPTHGAD